MARWLLMWGCVGLLGLGGAGCGRSMGASEPEPACGNGLLEPGEACDDGNLLPGDGCGADCVPEVHERCGDGQRDATEECDDGNLVSCDGCSADCLLERCGNDRLDCGELCDGDVVPDTCESTLGLSQGELRCTDTCRLDLSGCHECGNGFVESPGVAEECDGAALSGHSCVSLGFTGGQLGCDSQCRLDDSGCSSCGNDTIEDGEACDGPDLGGQTCQSAGLDSGLLACGPDCTLDVSGCGECGNAAVDGDEQCDDGDLDPGDGCSPACAVEPGWSCAGSPSVCIPNGCGDNIIDPNEACDGANLGGETCLSQGYLQAGGSGLACSADCLTFDLSGCSGGAIDGISQLEAAIEEAHASGGSERIGVHENAAADSYEVSSPIVIDECDGPCTGGLPHGVTIAPVGASVCFTSTAMSPVFEVVTGQNEFRNLCFDNVYQAYYLGSGNHAGGNVITHNWFDNTTLTPLYTVEIQSRGNAVLASRFFGVSPLPGFAAILVNEAGNTIAQNVIHGTYDWALFLTSFPNPNPMDVTFVDHNSVHASGAGGGVFVNNVDRLCYRYNIVYGSGASSGLYLAAANVASMAACGGFIAQGNVNLNHATLCTGPDCATHCAGTASWDMCDLALDPGWLDPELCLQPPTNPPNGLVDGAAVFQTPVYDLNDDDPAASYFGAAPDVGAREAGTSRTYGGVPSTCP